MKQLLLICAVVMGQSVLAADEKLIADPIVEKAVRKSLALNAVIATRSMHHRAYIRCGHTALIISHSVSGRVRQL